MTHGTPQDTRGRRIFVGDVQGCRAELEQLLEAVAFVAGTDELHPVGDLVNRGPDNAGTLRLCRELGAGGVLGNHDVHALRVRAGLEDDGRRDTLADLWRAADGDALCDWLALRPFLRVWPDVTLVHAGLSPRWKDPLRALAGLDPLRPHPNADFAVSVRYCDEDGDRPDEDWPPPAARSRFVPWYTHLPERPGHTVVYGHWSRAGLVVKPGVRGLDTGCVWGGELTAWIAEEDRFVSVPAARAYADF
jgi:bis(5'-nucleosyl)-tetraphosphatase (symmetrical)